MLSHDLKTPLSVVLGLTEILRDEPPESAEEQRRLFDTIEVSARRALGLAVNFVDTARIQSGKLRLDREAASLAEIVAQSVREQQTLARTRDVRIDTTVAPDLPPISVDRQMIDRVIANLLSNALKFSPRNSRVRLTLDRRGNEVLLAVADQGPGIAPEEHPKLFQSYSQVARTARKDSTGLGLFIIKTIVEAHGGRVGVRCPPEGGSVFEVRLPVHPQA